MNRREFLRMSSAGTLLAGVAPEVLAQSPQSTSATTANTSSAWDHGRVLHLLPTVNDREMLIKISVDRTLIAAPLLRVGTRTVPGRMSDTRGECWQFHAKGLDPGRRYRLSLVTGGKSGGKPLCEPWELATFPAPDARPERVRVLFYTCAGGHEQLTFLPAAI
jgi:hypothetical protein